MSNNLIQLRATHSGAGVAACGATGAVEKRALFRQAIRVETDDGARSLPGAHFAWHPASEEVVVDMERTQRRDRSSLKRKNAGMRANDFVR